MILPALFASTLVFAKPPSLDMDDSFAELDEKLVLNFVDSRTGRPVSGAKVVFQNVTGMTNDVGKVQFPFPTVDVDDTVLYASFSKDGYVSSQLPVTFMSGSIWNNKYSVTENLRIDELRIVLDWGDSPKDLDAHFRKKDGYHVSYQNMKNYQDIVVLDRDDRDGDGPETITIKRVEDDAVYRYFVEDYSNKGKTSSSTLSESHAHVVVYSNNGVEKYYRVPTDAEGTMWRVFTIRNGQIIDNNTLHSEEE